MPQYQGVWNLQDAARLQSQQQWVTDPNFRSTTLLLQADPDVTAAQNNTFLDSSSNDFVITRNGNTTQGTFTPFSQGWSNFFGGSGNYARTGTLAAIATTQSTFTVECWVYMTQAPTTPNNFSPAIGDLDPTGADANWTLGPMSTGKVRFYWWTGAANFAEGNSVLAFNTWYHIAASVSSNAISIYVNGVRETLTGTTTLTNRSSLYNSIGFAQRNNGTDLYVGYISNARIVSGAALYSGTSFNVPTSPLSIAGSGTTQLLTCQSNRFLDNSSNAVSVTPTGSSTSVQPFAPFAPQFQYTQSGIGGSGFFDGSGDYLNFTGSIAISGQFAAECWFYRLTSAGQQQTLFAFNSTSGAYASIRVDTDGNGNSNRNITANLSTNGSSWASTIAIASIYSKFGWNHVLVTRDGSNNVRVFLNGVLINTPSTVSGALYSASTTHSIGCNTLPGTATNVFTGYISDVRLVNGSIPTTYQTSSTTSGTTIFTPPSAPLTTSSQGATSGNVTLLTNFTNAGIIDGTMDNVLETVGNAQVSTSVVKYGSGSLAFDGTGDWLVFPSSQNFNMGTGNWTVECWALASTNAARGIFQITTGTLNSVSTGIGVGISSSTGFPWRVYHGTTATDTTTNATIGSWQHLAFVRNNGNVQLYLNGTSIYSATDTSDLSSYTFLTVGAWFSSSFPWLGYIDDFRITKGVARYLSNFLPPQVALPRQ
jgi:hypothetical protein